MSEKTLPLIVFFFIFNMLHTLASEHPLSLEDALRRAEEKSDLLQAKKMSLEAQESELDSVKGARLPHINAESSYQKHYDRSNMTIAAPTQSGSVVPMTLPIKKDYETSHSLTLTQVLYTFGQISNAIKMNEQAVELSKLDQQNFKRELVLNIKKSYFGSLLASRTVAIYKQSLQNAKENKEILIRRFNRGRPPQSDLLKLDRDIVSRTPEFLDAKKQKDEAIAQLKTLIYFEDEESEIALTSDYRVNQVKSVKELSLETPLLDMAKANLNLKDNYLSYTKSSLLPSLAFFSNVTYFGEDNDSKFGTKNSMKHLTSVGIKLTVPIWNGGEKWAKVSKATAEKTEAEYKLKDTELKLNLKLKTLKIEIDSLHEQLESSVKFIKLAEDTFRMSQNRFRNGQTTITELNDSELLLTKSKLQNEFIKFKIEMTYAEIENLTKIN